MKGENKYELRCRLNRLLGDGGPSIDRLTEDEWRWLVSQIENVTNKEIGRTIHSCFKCKRPHIDISETQGSLRGWRCYHCGFVFCEDCAEEHFKTKSGESSKT